MTSPSRNKVMEKTSSQENHQRQPLKCPRCSSCKTKFCYYNNYSLSQPRHFCKGCKRYWTRGGTLRNVPVGGGCRKTKKMIKRPSSNGGDHAINSSTVSTVTCSHIDNPHVFYSMPSNDHGTNFLLPRFDSDMNGGGLGLTYNNHVFVGSSTMNSLLASSINYACLMPNDDDMQTPNGNGIFGKDVRAGQNGSDWNPYPVDQQINSSDSSLIWSSASIGSWFDPSNMGSSVPSLI